jgi:hypothetical protein
LAHNLETKNEPLSLAVPETTITRPIIYGTTKAGTSQAISENAGIPTTDGRYIFWQDLQVTDQTQNTRNNLKGYDKVSNSYFDLRSNDGINYLVAARNGILVWYTWQNKKYQVYMAKVLDVLPSARQNQVPNTLERAYYPETGHTLSGTFKSFWEKSGGLPVFGYPLTEEFIEFNRDSNKNFAVQFFERQRFEYHPENKGTPYEVELSRLGVTDAQRRNLLTTPSFQRAGSKAGCTFVNETGHNLCDRFRTYWQTHGLEFGDAGITYREALALFGHPLSEEFTDPETGLVTQYFERAVFEYHPKNAGTAYEV